MRFHHLRRVGVTLTAATAMVLPAVSAAQAAPKASTPVPIDMAEGKLMSYVVNTKANPGFVQRTDRAIKTAGGTVVQSWPQIGVVVAHSTKSDFLAKVRQDKAVESAGPTRTAAVKEGTPGVPGSQKGSGAATAKKKSALGHDATPAPDPGEKDQWDMRMINADKAHQVTDGSRKVLVGVLDSGIDSSHPDLKANVDVANSVNCSTAGKVDKTANAWRNTTSEHGTHVAGTIAAARNGSGIVGVAPNVRMASVKVVNDEGFIYPEYAICGFMWAGEKKMDVTNNSYFVDPFEFWCADQELQAPAKEAVRRAVAWSTGRGVVHAAAAGNSGLDLANKTTDDQSPDDTTPIKRQINASCQDIPAELPGVVTVSAVDDQQDKATFSNYGYGVIDVAAPGRRILSTMPDGKYALLSGTSMASPHVAGVLALLKSTHPNATPAQLEDMVKKQTMDRPCPTSGDDAKKCVGNAAYNGFYGEGIVDAYAAVKR